MGGCRELREGESACRDCGGGAATRSAPLGPHSVSGAHKQAWALDFMMQRVWDGAAMQHAGKMVKMLLKNGRNAVEVVVQPAALTNRLSRPQ